MKQNHYLSSLFSCPFPHPVASPSWVMKYHLSLGATKEVTRPVSLIFRGDLTMSLEHDGDHSAAVIFLIEIARLGFSLSLEV